MFAVLRWGNIITDRAAPELTTKLCCPFQEVRRYLGKRAVVFYELYAVSPQVLDEGHTAAYQPDDKQLAYTVSVKGGVNADVIICHAITSFVSYKYKMQ